MHKTIGYYMKRLALTVFLIGISFSLILAFAPEHLWETTDRIVWILSVGGGMLFLVIAILLCAIGSLLDTVRSISAEWREVQLRLFQASADRNFSIDEILTENFEIDREDQSH